MKYYVSLVLLLLSTTVFASNNSNSNNSDTSNSNVSLDTDINTTINPSNSTSINNNLNNPVNIGPITNTNKLIGGSTEIDLDQNQFIKNSGNSSSNAVGGSGGHSNQSQSINDSGNSSSNSHTGDNTNTNALNQNNSGNNSKQNINFEAAQRPHAMVPNVGAVFGTPTATCALPAGGGGVGVGFGFNVLTAYINQECVKSETTKLAMSMGNHATADEIFCSMEHAKDTLQCLELNEKVAEIKSRRKLKVSDSSNVDKIQPKSGSDIPTDNSLTGKKPEYKWVAGTGFVLMYE